MEYGQKILNAVKIDINDFISYEGYDYRLKFEVETIDSEKGMYTCYSRNIPEVQIFSKVVKGNFSNETLFFYEENGDVEDVSDCGSIELYNLLKDYIDENYNTKF